MGRHFDILLSCLYPDIVFFKPNLVQTELERKEKFTKKIIIIIPLEKISWAQQPCIDFFCHQPSLALIAGLFQGFFADKILCEDWVRNSV